MKINYKQLQQDTKALVESEDVEYIRRLKDRLLQLSHALDINCSTICSLRRGFRAFQREGPNTYGVSETVFHNFDLSLEELLFQADQQKNRVDNLMKRIDGLSALVSTVSS